METTSCPTCGAPLPIAPAGTTQHCPFCNREIRASASPRLMETAPKRRGLLGFGVAAAAVAAGALVLALGAALLLFMRPQGTPRVVSVTTSSPFDAGAGSELAAPSLSGAAAMDAASSGGSAELADGPATITWTANVVSSSGAAPARGAACTLVLTALAGEGKADEGRVTLQCAGKVLYDSDDPLSGMSDETFGVDEEPVAGEAQAYVYQMTVRDIGSRAPPRAQISAATRDRVVDAFRDVDPVYRVHLDVKSDSAIRHGKPMLAENIPPFAEVVSRTAHVTATSGAVPFAAKSCRLLISPAKATGLTCRVGLACGGKTVYGAGTSGFDECAIRDGQPRSFSDPVPSPTDGDPVFAVDLDAATATLGDTAKSGATYSVIFSLAE